jgi:hypothetical protein
MNVIHSVEAMPPEVDSLVVLGKQYGVGSSKSDVEGSPDHLSDDSRINVVAAGMLWRPGQRLLLSGNKRAYFPDAASDYLAENFPHIPQAAYANPDDDSPDTLASTENVPAILGSEGYGQASLVTVGFHIKRAAGMFLRKSDVIVCAAASEYIQAERSEEDAEYIADWSAQTRIKLEKGKEFLLRRIDAGGGLGKTALRTVRP